MSKNTKIILVSVVFFAVVILFENFLFRFYESREDRQTNISMIILDEGKSWDDIKAGATQAAENKADINIVSLPVGCSVEDQFNAITNELNNHADYVLTAAVDSYALGSLLGDSYSDKVSFVENGINSDNYIAVETDNYQMGVSIANLIADEEKTDKKVAIIKGNRNTILLSDRLEGTVNTLIDAGIKYDIWVVDYSQDYSNLAANIANEQVDAMVVLNEEILTTVLEAVEETESNASIYAIANSDEAVYYLDNKQIKYLIYPDDFGMGYAAVKRILAPDTYISNDFKRLITYKIVSREDMYEGGYEKVLFPFVK